MPETRQPTQCPICQSADIEPLTVGKQSYVCRKCGARWTMSPVSEGPTGAVIY